MAKTLLPALLAALASSLCCIAPLLAALAGASGLAGAFSWLQPWRPWLIGLSAVLLAWAWWMHLKPKPAADCCAPAKKPRHQRTGFLATVTVLAVLLNAFPLYSHVFQANTRGAATELPADEARIVIDVRGMTCAGCEEHVAGALREVPGVVSAEASYKAGTATVAYDPDKARILDLMAAIDSSGYKALGPKAEQP
ncbi:MAG: mercuric transport protein MerTP [Flavobacteriales bacterium]